MYWSPLTLFVRERSKARRARAVLSTPGTDHGPAGKQRRRVRSDGDTPATENDSPVTFPRSVKRGFDCL
jgi:hypothetical protein